MTFIRLYEEKNERDHGRHNRFTLDGFVEWKEALPDQVKTDHADRLAGYLLGEIARDPKLVAAGLLQQQQASSHHVQLHKNVEDSLVEALVLPVFDEYRFYGSSLDVLGVVFETLARRGEKDTRIGQFFTPQEVVNFCADLVDPSPRDVILDPAVGTSRFLIAGMQKMLLRVGELPGRREDAEEGIKNRQLLGVDLDDWVATIAKMNMYIHGDGMSHMVKGNGLILSDRPVFDLYPHGIGGRVDLVLTNPPLGDTSYLIARDQWAGAAPRGAKPSDEEMSEYLQRLGVVPMRKPPLTQRDRRLRKLINALKRADDRLAELREKPQDTRTAASVRRWDAAKQATMRELEELRSKPDDEKELPLEPTGERRKGGAIFLGAIAQYLKKDRSPDAEVEWQGGQAAIVVDEGILNTPDYADVRAFIRANFFVKAVISLGRAAFKYLAHTDAKTSILYLVRKSDTNLEQREPVFYAHAERVGYSATGKWIGSDLPEVLDTYSKVRNVIRTCYRRHLFDDDECMEKVGDLPDFADRWHAQSPAVDRASRLDFFNARYHDIVARLKREGVDLVTLGTLIEAREPSHPLPSISNTYEFATIERNAASVNSKGNVQVRYLPRDLWIVNTGDIVVSGIDLVHGAVAVARSEVHGLVMSKEMYPYRVRRPKQLLPEYMALLLRTDVAKTLIHGWITGTSNRTRLSDAAQLLEIPVPMPPKLSEQKKVVALFNAAASARTSAADNAAKAATAAAKLWRIHMSQVVLDDEESDDGRAAEAEEVGVDSD